MIAEKENVFYYITVMNENYRQPAMPPGVEEGILRGMYRLRSWGEDNAQRVRLLGAGTILREVEAAAEILHSQYSVGVDVYSVTSFTELARDGQDVARWNLLHPEEPPRSTYTGALLEGDTPIVVASDYVKSLTEQLRGLVSADYRVLGTDGFGRSDTREELRHFFEVDRKFVTLAALRSLADQQKISMDVVRQARDDLGIDSAKANPRSV